MNQKTFALTAGVVFSLVAVLHALRLLLRWDAVIGGWHVPMWLGWLALAAGPGLIPRSHSRSVRAANGWAGGYR